MSRCEDSFYTMTNQNSVFYQVSVFIKFFIKFLEYDQWQEAAAGSCAMLVLHPVCPAGLVQIHELRRIWTMNPIRTTSRSVQEFSSDILWGSDKGAPRNPRRWPSQKFSTWARALKMQKMHVNVLSVNQDLNFSVVDAVVAPVAVLKKQKNQRKWLTRADWLYVTVVEENL